MRKVAIPKLVYSPWHSLEERLRSQNCEYPGVYMVAISRKDLTGKIPEYKDVSYIGMTNSKAGLKSRWWQFHRSITGYGGHSGGNSVYREMGHYDDWAEYLYVCSMPVLCNVINPTTEDLIKMGWVTYLEYESFSEYRNKFPRKKKPKFNTR